MPINPHGRCVDYRRPLGRQRLATCGMTGPSVATTAQPDRYSGSQSRSGAARPSGASSGRCTQRSSRGPSERGPRLGPAEWGLSTYPPRSEPSFPQRPQPPDRGRQANPESLTHEPGPRHPELLRDPVEIAQLAPGHVQLDGPIERLGVGFIDRSHAASTPRAGRQHLAVSLRDATDQVQVVACFKQSVDAHGVRASSRSSISSQEYAEFGGTRDPRVSASHHTHLVLRHD